MLPDHFYIADVNEGPKSRRLYFYANVLGLTNPEYGYVEDNSWIETAYLRIVGEVERRLSVQPVGFEIVPGASVVVSEPRELSRDEIAKYDPAVNGIVLNAIEQTKPEFEEALRAVRVTWHWQVSHEAGGEAAVYVRLEDDVTAAVRGFALSELKNGNSAREQIRRLYQQLLRDASRKLILNMLRQGAGAGKD